MFLIFSCVVSKLIAFAAGYLDPVWGFYHLSDVTCHLDYVHVETDAVVASLDPLCVSGFQFVSRMYGANWVSG
jgi:hypothetical protein